MKYVLDLFGKRVVLTHTQLELIAETVSGAEVLESKYCSIKTSNSSHYTYHIETPVLHDWFKPTVVEDDYIDTLKLAAKLQAE
jgi:hypothetical protein